MDHSTKAIIEKVALREFLAHGYHKASLRKIAAKAELTTGAIYFFFKNKDDLFLSLLRPLLDALEETMYRRRQADGRYTPMNTPAGEAEDIKAAREIIELMDRYREEARLLQENREHPQLSAFIDRMIAESEASLKAVVEASDRELSGTVYHWISHLQIERFFYIFEHCSDKEEAYAEAETMVKFLRGGFYELLK